MIEQCRNIKSLTDSAIICKVNQCFALMRGLACRNPVIQKRYYTLMWSNFCPYDSRELALLALLHRLFQHIDVFLKACSEGKGHFNDSVGGLLQEIFKGGPSFALSIKENHVFAMLALLREPSTVQDMQSSSSHTSSSTSFKAAIVNALTELLVVCLIK